MAPDSLLSELLAFPPHPPPQQPLPSKQYDTDIRALVTTVASITPSKLIAPVSGKDTLLDILDPSINSIPYLFSLLAHAKASEIVPGTKLWDYTINFVHSFDPIQMRFCGHQFRELLQVLHKGAGTKSAATDTALAVQTICSAMMRLDPSCSTLTSTHITVVETCLQERTFALAFPLLEKDIYHLPGPVGSEYNYPRFLCDPNTTSANFITVATGLTDPLTYQDYLTYFLYGASIYTACRQWDRALSFFEIVLAAPGSSNSVSMIQVEAYKRWCLVSILVHGQAGRMPHNTTQFVSKQCQNVARAYHVLGDVFNQKDTKRLQAEIEAGPFRQDCNYSLALLVLGAHYRFAISNLSRTYARLPIKFIPALVSRPEDSIVETETSIAELIASKQLQATLVKSEANDDTILEFHTAAMTGTSEDDLLRQQLEQKEKMMILQERMAEAQRRIELSKEYLVAARKQRNTDATRKHAQAGLDDDDMLADE